MLAMTPSSEPEMATAGLMIAFFPAHFFALPLRCCLSECSRDRLFSADFLRCLLDVAFPGAREISLFFPLTFRVAFLTLRIQVLAVLPFPVAF